VNNHEELELQLQDLNFAKLNQTRTRTMERSTKQGSNTRASDADHERNCIATHLYNNHLTLLELLGKQLRLSGPSKGIGLCKHLRKYAAWQTCSLEACNNKAKIRHSNMVENVFYPAENAKGDI
jgi:hypothetical protein